MLTLPPPTLSARQAQNLLVMLRPQIEAAAALLEAAQALQAIVNVQQPPPSGADRPQATQEPAPQ